MDINLGQREYLLEILNYEYVIPDELHDCVKDAIRRYATNGKYTESSIDAMIKKPQSMASSIGAIREGNLSLFRGKFAEWIACIEYNALKNKGNVVMTIINPDTTSKADLLHIIKKGDRYEAIHGPDIKCGGSTYVFNQWKKIVNSRHDIPMVDMDDALTTEEGIKMLTRKQREEFEELKRLFPKKKPIRSEWNKQDINRLMMDYLEYVSEDVTPSTPNNKTFIASKENREKIKEKLMQLQEKTISQNNWNEFYKKSASLPDISDDYKSKMTLAKHEKSQEEKVTKKNLKSSIGNNKNINKETKTSKKNKTAAIAKHGKSNKKGFLSGVTKFLGYDTPTEMAGDAFTKIVIPLSKVVIYRAIDIVADKIFGGRSNSQSDIFKQTEKVKNNDSSGDVNIKVNNNHSVSNETHSSHNEHIVKEHGQHYHTKKGIEWREKKPYSRGNKDENI